MCYYGNRMKINYSDKKLKDFFENLDKDFLKRFTMMLCLLRKYRKRV